MKQNQKSKVNLQQQETQDNSQSRSEAEVKYNEEFVKKVLEADKRGDLEPFDGATAFFDQYRRRKLEK